MNKLVYRAGTCHGQRGFGVSIALIVLLFVMALAGTIWVSMGVVAKERWPIRWLDVNGPFERVSKLVGPKAVYISESDLPKD